MPNKWITFVKKYAAKHNLSYGCAISTPECKQEYHLQNPNPSPKVLPKSLPPLLEERKKKKKLVIIESPVEDYSPKPLTEYVATFPPAMRKEKRKQIDDLIEDAIKDIFYSDFPEFMKGTTNTREKVYKHQFLSQSKKVQDEIRNEVEKQLKKQLNV
jgi:hypothetical protein